MPKRLSRLEQLAFAQLVDLSHHRVASDFPMNGSFVKANRDNGPHWYFQWHQKPADGSPGKQTRKYVGRVGDPAIEALREAHIVTHERYRERRSIAASLRRASLPAPLPFAGAVIDAIQKSGAFDANAILIGSTAFQTYPGLIGKRLDRTLMRSGNLGLAQSRGIHISASFRPLDIEDLLRTVDASFRSMPAQVHREAHLGYVNGHGYKIEFLTSMARKTRPANDFVPFRGIARAYAQPVEFLEYLLQDPVRSVVLHDDGIPVTVPSPSRYAVHKLIVSHMRTKIAEQRGTAAPTIAKAHKDTAQASALIRAFAENNGSNEIALAWEDAWRRGPKWREHLRQGLRKLDSQSQGLLETAILENIGPGAWPASKPQNRSKTGEDPTKAQDPRKPSGPTR